MNLTSDTDSFVAQSTPPGISALALIRASGSSCTKYAEQLLGKNNSPIPRHTYFSKLKNGEGELIDEVVWIYYEPGSSYTGEAMIEIMPHGNPLICKMIIEDFCRRGFRLAEPGEFTKRAYLNKKLKFSQIKGVLETIHAQSDRALSAARKRLTGASDNHIKGIVQELTKLRAEIEAYIDFPEDELPPEDKDGPPAQIKKIISRLNSLNATAKNREIIQNGINTLILGSPNAGKSSLLNLLVGHNRALVSKEAGTTRDYILEHIEIDGYLINLFDTAGLNISPKGELESLGIEHTLELVDQSDFFLVVLDSTIDPPELPASIVSAINPRNCIIVENKIDLPESRTRNDYFADFPHSRISALDNLSLEDLGSKWKNLIAQNFEIREEEGLMFDLRERSFIQESLKELEQAHQLLSEDSSTELAAFHLIRASESLHKINEHVDNEAILDELFSRFCIGK